MIEPLLNIEHVTKRFDGLTAVQDVSFSVPRAAITAVIGPNGAGKTTLFNLISGFHRADQGRIVFAEQEITNSSPEQVARIGIIRTFQITRLFRQMTALQNVLVGFHLSTRGNVLAALLRRRWFREQDRCIEAEGRRLLEIVGLAGLADTLAANLTGGQNRLLEVARALAAKPKLLMLDEPAAGLNASETAELMRLVRDVREQGMTVLLVEHDMKLVMDLADEVQVLDFGRRIAGGNPALVQSHPAVIEAYLGAGSHPKEAYHA